MLRGYEHSWQPHWISLMGFFLSDSNRQFIYMGDDNALTLEVSAENRGEGAYEAELHVYPPPQADFTGVVRGPQVGGTPFNPFDDISRWCNLTDFACVWLADPKPALMRLQKGEPDQAGGVWPGQPHEGRGQGMWHDPAVIIVWESSPQWIQGFVSVQGLPLYKCASFV